MGEPSSEELRQALQDLEDLLYYWPGDHEFDQVMQEVIAAELLIEADGGYAMTEKGHAYVESWLWLCSMISKM